MGSLKHHGCWSVFLVANECIPLCELLTSEGDKNLNLPITMSQCFTRLAIVLTDIVGWPGNKAKLDVVVVSIVMLY